MHRSIAAQWPFELERVNKKPDAECFDEALNYKIAAAIKVSVPTVGSAQT